MKESFIIYCRFYKPISFLSDKQLGKLFRAIFRYNLGEVVEVEDDIRMAFEFFKNQFELDESKYQAKIKRSVEDGRKGGNPNFKKGQANPYYKKNDEEESIAKPLRGSRTEPTISEQGHLDEYKESNAVSCEISCERKDNPSLSDITQDNPSLSDITLNDNVYDNANDISKESTPNGVPKKGELSLPDPVEEKIDYVGLMNYFNTAFSGKLSAIVKMTDARKKAVKARVAQYGKDKIITVFNLVLQSPFLLGDNNRNWRADFDWIFKSANFTKILEGAYAGRSNEHRATGMDVGVILTNNSTNKYDNESSRWDR